MGNETKAASFLMGGIVGVLIGCLGTVYMYTYSEKQEQRQRNLRAREERYAREWEESEKKVVGNVKNYFYNGKKLVISAQDDSSIFLVWQF